MAVLCIYVEQGGFLRGDILALGLGETINTVFLLIPMIFPIHFRICRQRSVREFSKIFLFRGMDLTFHEMLRIPST